MNTTEDSVFTKYKLSRFAPAIWVRLTTGDVIRVSLQDIMNAREKYSAINFIDRPTKPLHFSYHKRPSDMSIPTSWIEPQHIAEILECPS